MSIQGCKRSIPEFTAFESVQRVPQVPTGVGIKINLLRGLTLDPSETVNLGSCANGNGAEFQGVNHVSVEGTRSPVFS